MSLYSIYRDCQRSENPLIRTESHRRESAADGLIGSMTAITTIAIFIIPMLSRSLFIKAWFGCGGGAVGRNIIARNIIACKLAEHDRVDCKTRAPKKSKVGIRFSQQRCTSPNSVQVTCVLEGMDIIFYATVYPHTLSKNTLWSV